MHVTSHPRAAGILIYFSNHFAPKYLTWRIANTFSKWLLGSTRLNKKICSRVTNNILILYLEYYLPLQRWIFSDIFNNNNNNHIPHSAMLIFIYNRRLLTSTRLNEKLCSRIANKILILYLQYYLPLQLWIFRSIFSNKNNNAYSIQRWANIQQTNFSLDPWKELKSFENKLKNLDIQ